MRCLREVAVVFAALALVACDSKSPTAPDGPNGPGASNASLVSLAVTGQNQIKVKSTTPFTATAHYSDGTSANVSSQATWASSAGGICTVGSGGIATGVGEGSCEISATFTAVSGRFNLEVASDPSNPSTPGTSPPSTGRVLNHVFVSGPGSITVGQTVTWQATAFWSDDTQSNVTAESVWSSASPAIATAASGGQVKGVSAGNTSIQATYQGMSDSGGIVVSGGGAPTVVSLAITGNTSIQAGQTSQLQAIATMSNGTTQTVTNSSSWSSSATAIATVSSTGLVTGVSQGQAPITATFQEKTASVTMVISAAPAPTVVSLAVTGNANIQVGQTSQLTATATMSNGTTQTVTNSSTWVSGATGVATVSSTGLVTAVSQGQAPVTATYQGQSASITMVITNAPPVEPTTTGLTITGVVCTTVGTSSQLQAIAQMSNGTTQNRTATATWTTGNAAVATVAAGLVQCVAVGTTTITATVAGPFSANVPVTVVAAPKQLIGIRVDVEGNVLTGNGPVGLGLASLLQDPLLTVNVFALYSDGSEQNVTALAAITTSTPLLVVNGPGVVNAAGVLVQALINPSHYINVTYQGFTVIANVIINVPVLGQLPITGLITNGTVANLGVGTKLPDLTAILSGPGVQGTVNLLIPATTAGIQWNIRPKLLTNCGLLSIVCGTVNAALQGLGNLANGVVTIVDGTVQNLSLGGLNTILAPVVSLLGGVLQVDINPIINGISGPAWNCRIPL